MKSRLLTILLSGVLLLGLVACDGGAPAETVPPATDAPTGALAETTAEIPTESPTESPTGFPTDAPTELAPAVYYVCNDSSDPSGSAFRTFESEANAIKLCDRLAAQGYRVISGEGELVYAPYTEFQCDILVECKRVTDFVRDNRFKYGDAPVNPAMNYRARKVSCDRFVCWVMYNMGYTDQPRTQGVVVSAMAAWCEKNGFELVEREADLQPGDIVLVKYNGSWPAHTFIYAGEAKGGHTYRYDCGSDTRIQSTQPSTEPIVQFWRAYRPVEASPHRQAEGTFQKLPLD